MNGEKIKTHVNDNEYADSSRLCTIAEVFLHHYGTAFEVCIIEFDERK